MVVGAGGGAPLPLHHQGLGGEELFPPAYGGGGGDCGGDGVLEEVGLCVPVGERGFCYETFVPYFFLSKLFKHTFLNILCTKTINFQEFAFIKKNVSFIYS